MTEHIQCPQCTCRAPVFEQSEPSAQWARCEMCGAIIIWGTYGEITVASLVIGEAIANGTLPESMTKGDT